MQFALVSVSSDPNVTPLVLEQIAGAVERQLYEHYAPFWETVGAPVKVFSDLKSVPTSSWPVIILDDSEQAGYLGYHDVTPDGRPFARVFWKPIRGSGGTLTSGSNSLSVTVSHEILEMIGDSYASFWAAEPSTGILYACELCDAVESQSYEVDGIAVSNFVGPRFFRAGPGPYDWMSQLQGKNLVKRPFETTQGGYQIVAVSMQNITQVFGADYPEWKKEDKSHPAARTQRRCRKMKKE